ncbi:hypothetical protein WMW72_25235 [Paenibacillus filicis]|uniref:Uncharacterized protein n=1 Tax=Paenibacillus filicis TaxID=669464 RepID=A0ABU9DQT5_9BACL
MDIRHDNQAYTVQATQRAMVGVLIPAMLSPITIGVIMVNRQAGDWAWLVIVFMLIWIVLGLVLASKLLRSQLLSADEQGVRYGRKATPWLEMKKLVL